MDPIDRPASGSTGPTGPVPGQVIDLRPDTETVRLDGPLNPFDRLSHEERVRLIVRVLCELVAYDAPEDEQAELSA